MLGIGNWVSVLGLGFFGGWDRMVDALFWFSSVCRCGCIVTYMSRIGQVGILEVCFNCAWRRWD
jgi:hypothetical protein